LKNINTINLQSKMTFLMLFLLFTLPISANAQESTVISSAKITFVYTSNDTEGSIAGFSSSTSLNLENPERSVFKGKVQTETIETGNFLRNWSLRGSKYFDVDTYPTISFNSTSVTVTDRGYTVKGDLTIKKTTKAITITFIRNGKKLTGTTTLYSSDYGIDIKKNRADNKVTVQMVFSLK